VMGGELALDAGVTSADGTVPGRGTESG
jgi:hypothetical protein